MICNRYPTEVSPLPGKLDNDAIAPYNIDMQKTTIYLDPNVRRTLQRLAKSRRKTQSAVIRDAVLAYAGCAPKRPKATCIGSGRSGMPDLADRCEEFLDGFGEDK